MYVLVYLDDFIATEDNHNTIVSFVNAEILVSFVTFLVLKHCFGKMDLWFFQARYAKDILTHFGMSQCTSVIILVVPNSKLAKNQGKLLDDVTTCRSLVRSLQNLTLIRPDITYRMSQVHNIFIVQQMFIYKRPRGSCNISTVC